MNFKTWWQKRWLLSDGCGVKCIPNRGPLDKWLPSLPYTCLHAKLLQSCLTLWHYTIYMATKALKATLLSEQA